MFLYLFIGYFINVLFCNLIGRIFYKMKCSSLPNGFDVFLVFVPVFNLIQSFVFLCEILSNYLDRKGSSFTNWFFGIKE